MVVQEKLTTVAEFEAFIARPEHADRRFELVNGEIIEHMPTERHGLIVLIFGGEFYAYLKRNPIGRATVETRHTVPGDDLNTRIPDISFTLNERLEPVVERGAVPKLPDIAVEVKSPDDRYTALREKAAYYLANGCRMVWLVFPEIRLVEVYRVGADDVELLSAADTLHGYDLLPGFTLPIAEIFKEG